MKRYRKGFLIILSAVLFLICSILLGRIINCVHITTLLKQTWEQDQAVSSLHLQTEDRATELSFSWDTILDERYYSIETGPEVLSIHNGALCFSNGRGYDLSGITDDFPFSSDLVWTALFLADMEISCQNHGRLWQIRFPELMIQRVGKYEDALRTLSLSIYEESGTLKTVSVSHDLFRLDIRMENSTPDPVPTELLMEIKTGTLPDIRSLEPLVQACTHLMESGPVTADAVLLADCGFMTVSDTGQLHLSEEGLSLNRNGKQASLIPESADRSALIAGACWFLIRDGIWTPGSSGSGTFSVTLPGEELKSAVLSILPELEELDFRLEDGTLLIQIAQGRFSEMHLSCTGELPFFITTIPLSIQMDILLNG